MVGKFLAQSTKPADGNEMETNMSLDDIIQKKFRKTGNKRGKRGAPIGRKGQDKQSGNPQAQGRVQTKQNKPGANARGGMGGRRGGRGGGNRPVAAMTGDARSRIIQQKRQKITDAREKLGEIAKMSDARLKLNKLHGQTGGGGTVHSGPNILGSRGGITMQTGRNGQILLSTNKARRQQQTSFHQAGPVAPPVRRISNTIPSLLDGAYHLDTDLTNSPSLALLQRTVHNPTRAPSAQPMYSHPRQRAAYTWRKSEPDDIEEDIYNQMARTSIRPKTFHDLEPVKRRPQTNTIRIHTRDTSPQQSLEWSRQEPLTKRLKVTRPVQQSREEPYLVVEDDDDWMDTRTIGVKSRLDASIPVPHSMGILAAESKASVAGAMSRAPVPVTYHRIIVSNLQKSVTNEDIRELFEDIGSLVTSKLVRPGTAEVVYRSRKDAMKAVDIYHNRQLDGEPMKCMLVNPRVLPTISQPSSSRTASASHLRGMGSKYPPSKKSTVYPDMDTIHKALFKRT